MEATVKQIQNELLKHNHYVDTAEITNFCKNSVQNAEHTLADLKANGKGSIIVRCCKYKTEGYVGSTASYEQFIGSGITGSR